MSTTLIKDTTFMTLEELYVGLEEMCWTDSTGKKECYNNPENPKYKWYHLSYLKIKGDSAFLDQNPISIYKSDTASSASDGGFYYYSGTLKKSDTTITFDLKELFCDYCPEPAEKLADGTYKRIYRTKRYIGKLTDQGIIINNYLFAKDTNIQILISEHAKPYIDNFK